MNENWAYWRSRLVLALQLVILITNSYNISWSFSYLLRFPFVDICNRLYRSSLTDVDFPCKRLSGYKTRLAFHVLLVKLFRFIELCILRCFLFLFVQVQSFIVKSDCLMMQNNFGWALCVFTCSALRRVAVIDRVFNQVELHPDRPLHDDSIHPLTAT